MVGEKTYYVSAIGIQYLIDPIQALSIGQTLW